MRAVGVGPGGGCVRKPIVARACRTVSLLGVPRAVRRQLTLLGAESPAGTRLLIVDLAGLEDEAAGRLDRMERRATATQLAMHREQRKIPDFALRARQRLGEQDPGAQRPATAARLAQPLRSPSVAAGNAGGRRSFSRNLLPGGQLDLCWTDHRSRPHGPRA